MTAESQMPRRLLRTREDSMIAGVCGGLAAHLDVDATIIRVAFVLLALVHGLGFVLYGVLALLTPREGSEASSSREVVRVNASSARARIRSAARDLRGVFRQVHSTGGADAEPAGDGDTGSQPEDATAEPEADTAGQTPGVAPDVPGHREGGATGAYEPPAPPPPHRHTGRSGWGLGLVLFLLGALLLARNLGFFFWIDWQTWWPAILIVIGCWMLVRRATE